MKKKLKSVFSCLFFTFCYSLASSLATAQIPVQSPPIDPDEWEKFVNSEDNPLIRDTFLLQTFSGSPKDNWNYTTTGKVEIFDASEEGIENQGGSLSFRLTPNSEIRFDPFSIDGYNDVRINFRFAGKELRTDQDLLISTTRPTNSLTDMAIHQGATSSYLYNYKQQQITGNPSDLSLRMTPGNNKETGFYCLNSIYAFGLLSPYTLFSGTGDWETSECWSHHPAIASQRALIWGKATVNTSLSCRSLAIEGSVTLSPDIRLQTDELAFYATASPSANEANYFISAGTIEVTGTTSLYKTFPQTGAWYFFSLPFDVYADGLDPAFEWKDDEPNEGGNFFYLRRYNEQQRAATHTPEGNWDILRPHLQAPDEPVLRKNQGYLIALDAKAHTSTLRFTSRPGAIPESFGQNGEISLQFTSPDDETNDPHAGWNLCGNPIPAALPLRALSADASTDGYIYMYNGTSYQRYAFGSDYTIPPFTAFFIKANRPVQLTWHMQTASQLRQYPIPLPPAFHTSFSTSKGVFQEPGPAPLTNAPLPDISLQGHLLYMYSMPSEVLIRLNDSAGRLLYTRTEPAGNSRVALPRAQGICFLTIEALGFTRRIKYRME